MEEKIREAFDSVQMRDSLAEVLAEQIRMEQRQSGKRRRQRIRNLSAIAAVFVLMTVLLVSNPHVVSAVEVTIERITGRDYRHRMLDDELIYMDPAIKVFRRKDNYSIQGEVPQIVHPWYRIENQRLYYVDYRDDRIRIDLSDILSEEEPVLIQFVDDYGMIHYLAFGGSYHGEPELPESVGFLEVLWNPFRTRLDENGYEHPFPGVDGGFAAENYRTPEDWDGRRAWFLKAKKLIADAFPNRSSE